MPPSMPNSSKKKSIREIYRALELLGADNGILGTVGSWSVGEYYEEDAVSEIKLWFREWLNQL